MLVKLNSNTAGEMLMLADTAHRLFAIIGKEGTARGVFTNAQLPDAIARLRQAVLEEKSAARSAPPPDKDPAGDDKDPAPPEIGLAQRAHPLIKLMELTYREDGLVMWEADGDF
jgi:hypothetical protein